MSLAPVTMGAMKKTGQTQDESPARNQEPAEALMARDLAAWQLAKAAIAKAMAGSGK